MTPVVYASQLSHLSYWINFKQLSRQRNYSAVCITPQRRIHEAVHHWVKVLRHFLKDYKQWKLAKVLWKQMWCFDVYYLLVTIGHLQNKTHLQCRGPATANNLAFIVTSPSWNCVSLIKTRVIKKARFQTNREWPRVQPPTVIRPSLYNPVQVS